MNKIIDVLQSLRHQFETMSATQRDVLLIITAFVAIWLLQILVKWVLVRLVRQVAKYRHAAWDQEVLGMINAPARYLVIVVTLQAVATLAEVSDSLRAALNNISLSLLILAAAQLFYRLVSQSTRTTLLLQNITGVHIPGPLLPFVRTILRLVLLVIGLALILEQWGYNVATLTAGLGIGGLALALAAQETIANLFGFTMIVGDRPFSVGEFIVTPDLEGEVEAVGIRSTRIRRPDQALITVPNSKRAGSVILNWSRLERRRLNFVLRITYEATRAQLKNLLERLREMLRARPAVDQESVVVYFTDFGDSALEILVRCYISIKDWGEFTAEKEQINLQVMEIVEELGLNIALPSVYIEDLPKLMQVKAAWQTQTAAVDSTPAGRETNDQPGEPLPPGG